MTKSALQIARAAYQPKLPKALKGAVKVKEGEPTQSVADQEAIKALFPNTYGMPLIQFVEGEAVNLPAINVGVILSGGQAPGGHNVISGLFDGIKALNKDSKLFGFILGPGGLVDHNYMELTADIIDEYRNTGGFDIIGSGRTKLEKEEQFDKGLEIIKELGIKALVIIGGDDSNTNACVLAEYYAAKNCGVQVIGCPKTIDGDLKNEMIETSFGFDTACKTYAEVIGNIQRDCNSARKYWHFIKLMGRSASHIALECAKISKYYIQKKYKINIDEDELGYIALHFSAAIAEKRENLNKKNVLLVCASGKATAKVLKYRFLHEFSKYINILDTSDYLKLKEINIKKYNLIVTTIPLDLYTDIPVVEVSAYLYKKDISQILSILKNKNIFDNIKCLFDREFLFISTDIKFSLHTELRGWGIATLFSKHVEANSSLSINSL